MKRKFTLLIAALALLTMIVQPSRAWGQAPVNTVLWGETWARFSANAVPSGEQSGDGLTIYGSATVEYSVTNGSGTTKIYNENLAGGTAPELLLAKSNATWTITGIPTGQATEMSLVFLSNKTTLSLTSTTEGITISGSGKNWTITATSSVLSFNLTLTNTGSANARIDDFVLTVTTAGGGGGSDPEIHFNGQSANIGTNHPVGTPVSTQFTVYQSNLTENISFEIEGYGSLDPSSVAQGADATEVTWSYTPTAAGEFNTTITATSGTASAIYNIYGEAKSIHNVNIAEMTNGSVTASPISGIQGTNIDLTITPDAGYALASLTVVDKDNNEITVTNKRFQMPDSDVTVSATFEASSTTTTEDVLTYSLIGVTGTSYSAWSGITSNSDAVYAGNSAGGNSAIQLRSNNNNSGIVTTTSGGKVTKVVVAWNTNTADDRTLNIYGNNTAYEAASDLYNSSTQGTLLGTIVKGSTELTIDDDYEFIGLRSSSGALYLDEVSITWATDAPTSDPSITANNVGIDYNVTSGSIEYTINNPVTGGELTAATTADWLILGTVGETVPFTCTVNEAAANRTATVTLTYTYGDSQTVNKNVTVTQAGDPNVTPTIAEVREQGSGSVVTKGIVTSCVGTTGYIQDATAAICVYGTALTVGDEIRVSGTLSNYNGLLEITSPEVTVISQGNTIEPELMTIEEIVASTNQGWYVRIEEATVTEISGQNTTIAQGDNTIVVRGITGVEYAVNDVLSLNGNIGCYNTTQIANPQNVEVQQQTEPSITVTPATVSVDAEEHDGTLNLTYDNLTITGIGDFDIQYYDAQGEETDEPGWVVVLVAEQDPTIGEGYVVSYMIENNEGEARTAYFKVYALDGEELVYSNLVTVTQAKYVNPYATLPFAFDGGRADIEDTDGLSQENLGTDYSSSPKLKFEKGNKDNDGLYSTLVLQFNERPGTLTFDIKGNSFSDGTFTVQTSEDGVTYTDLETYTELGNTQSEEFDNLGENVRYIKWIYTEKVNGNVALGNINLAKYVEPVLIPSITVDPAAVSADAEEHDGTLDLTYENLTITSMDDFDIQYYDAQGEETTEPDWVEVLIAEQDPTIGEGYVVSYYMIENEGDARTAYFKVYALDGEEVVYSNLVTINQAAYVPTPTGVTYTLVTDASQIESGKHYIIVGYKNSIPYAMGLQKANNRGAIEILVNEEVATVSSNDVYEFVINGPTVVENISYYTIYDKLTPGYLYAPGNNNYLKTQTTNTDNGMWTVEFDNYVAIIKAKVENKNWMRFNTNGNNDPLFSCYGSGQTDIYLFVKDNDTDYEYYGCELTYSGDYAIPADETITIGAGSVMEVTGNLTNTTTSNLIIEDGGQLIVNNSVAATVEKTIQASGSWGSKDGGVDGWDLISSPIGTVNIASVTNLAPAPVGTALQYDLYSYNEASKTWYNQQGTEHQFTQLMVGEGYLYSRKENADLGFAGEVSSASITKALTYTEANGTLAGWNLVGNPYTHNITWANLEPTNVVTTGYYTLGYDGQWSAEPSTTTVIKPMQGFLVKANDSGAKIIFNNTASKSRANDDYIKFIVANSQYEDAAYAMFSENVGLDKINHRNADIPMVYIPQNGQNYAIATMDDNTQAFELNFKAMTTGQYTLSYKAEGKYSYLHVIDRLTGEDIDMLLDGEYSFIGSPRDNEARFIVKLSYNANIDEIEVNDNFAYQNGSDIIVNGNGELQVFDVTGRMVMNTKINGIQTVNVPATGMYIFRMVGESVQTQKIVVR